MQQHVPVMLNEVLQYIPNNAKIIVDGTLWHGWHSKAILDNCSWIQKLIWFDLDPNIFSKTKSNLSSYPNFLAINKSYTQMDSELEILWVKADFVLLDLWVNMEHYKDGDRWFSSNFDAKLDMRFDNTKWDSAYDIINNYDPERLSEIFQTYADFSESKSEEISKKIVSTRIKKEIKTTKDLKELLSQCWLWIKATNVIFQSLRIHINQEMQNVKTVLSKIPKILNKAWICCVITYHSIEDRLVKTEFKSLELENPQIKILNKKVLKPTYQEVQRNRASRSAKMRMLISE